ncbi:unnamed protein product [Cercopithifilaria johnstoni]|uniref:Uncharacterized protein n=1 Tax=Cercopithifilaria johnstoni TaxID=2874296 RepID=A0A8J2MAV9_9BILA|nr:unnamed protein product [Cercopithifilaria johnstoni]
MFEQLFGFFETNLGYATVDILSYQPIKEKTRVFIRILDYDLRRDYDLSECPIHARGSMVLLFYSSF